MNILQRMKQERPYLQLLSCKENIIIILLSVIVFLSVLRHADINRTIVKLLTTALLQIQNPSNELHSFAIDNESCHLAFTEIWVSFQALSQLLNCGDIS